MDREELDGWCERGIQGLVIAILIFGPLAFGAVDTVPFVVIEGLTVLALLLWTARFWINERLRLLWPPACWAVLGFAVYTVVRYFTSEVEYVARGEMMHVLVYALLFFVIVNNVHRQDATQAVACILVFLAMAISGYALYQFLTGTTRVWHLHNPYPHRGTGTYINPNHLGGFLEMVLPLALAFTLVSRFKAVPRIFLGYSALVILAGIAVTHSRGSWLSTAGTILLFFGLMALSRAHRLPALALLLVIVGGLVVLVPKSRIFHNRAQFMVNGKLDDDRRFDLWRPAISIWRENVWWGGGPGLYNERFRAYRPESVQQQPDNAHNDYLNTLADYGLAGAVLITSTLGLVIAGLVSTWRKVRPATRDIAQKTGSNKYAFLFGASLGLLAIMLHSVVDFNLHIPANAILAVALTALLTGYTRFSTDRFWFRARAWLRVPITLILVATVCVLAQQGVGQFQEHTWLARAEASPAFSTRQIYCLKQAFIVEPKNGETAWQVGEALRRQAQEGGYHYEDAAAGDYPSLTREAMEWFQRSAKLNPLNNNPWLGYGWCLDWLERHEEAEVYFWKAEQLDPNNYFNMFKIGLHYVEKGDYSAARPWFERSIRLQADPTKIAVPYLAIANDRLMEAATNAIAARLSEAVKTSQ
jgi:O-antigen ligase/Flp pilus assembly protein TadD